MDEKGFAPVVGLILLILAIAGIVFLSIGGTRANDHCFASALFWFGAAALAFGADGTVAFKNLWGVGAGGAAFAVLALAGAFLGTYAGGC